MTDTPIETNDFNDTSESEAAYEAMRQESEGADYQDDSTGHEDGAEQPPETDKAVDDVEGIKASLKDRAAAARREKQARIAAEERATALEARLAALEGKGEQDDLTLDDIDVEKDPIGAVERMKAILKAQQESQTKQSSAQQAEQLQRRNVQDLSNWAADYEQDFKAEHNDYDDAASFLRDSRIKELTVLHGSEQAAEQELFKELLGVVAHCKQKNLDPAETVYNLAKSRGFSKTAVAIDNAAKPLQKVKQGQSASRTITGGRPEQSELTIEAINQMPSDKRYAAYQRLKEQELAKEARG